MKPYLVLIGAYARDNFGDLLYPKIMEKCFPSYSIIRASGLTGKDLTSIGGDCVVNVREFLSDPNNYPSAVIHCGGETITLSKKSGVSFNLPPTLIKKAGKLYLGSEEEISNKLTDSRKILAYLYNHEDFSTNKSSFPIAFLSIGGSSLYRFSKNNSFLSIIKSKLKYSKYLSVRDGKTKEYLKNYLGVESKVHPDISHLLAKTNLPEIREAENNVNIKMILEGLPYILFQANQKIISRSGTEFWATRLAEIGQKMNKALVLQPAGLASGHDSLDQLRDLAEKISKKKPKVFVKLQEDRNLWGQVAIIANSFCSISSSLHVRIVSLAFGRPGCSLENEKTSNYLRSWEISPDCCDVPANKLLSVLEKAVNTKPETFKKTQELMVVQAEDSLKEMSNRLKLNFGNKSFQGETEIEPEKLFQALSQETERLRETLAKEIISKRGLEIEKVAILAELNELKSSKSWKITKPLRSIYRLIKLGHVRDNTRNLYYLYLPLLFILSLPDTVFSD